MCAVIDAEKEKPAKRFAAVQRRVSFDHGKRVICAERGYVKAIGSVCEERWIIVC